MKFLIPVRSSIYDNTIDSINYVPGIGNFNYYVLACQAYLHLDFQHLAYKTSLLSNV